MDLEDRIGQFWDHVWDHSTDPFQTQFDYRASLTKQELEAVDLIVEVLPNRSDEEVAMFIARLLQSQGEELMDLLLQMAGLTRSKILTDTKAMALTADQKIRVPSSHRKLPEATDAWKLAGPYIVRGLRPVLGGLSGKIERANIYEALSQATWPGYVRQERAKRSGHQAEYRLAIVLDACRIPFEPKEKLHNPMCRDVQIHDVSFNLVVPSKEELQVAVKCTVHTAVIGQYGESKDALEMSEARDMLDKHYPSDGGPILVTLADGVGFKGNVAGLKAVLSTADEFCQFRTIWKLIVVCACKLGLGIPLILPKAEIERHADFIRRYGYENLVMAKEENPPPVGAVNAGDGVFLLR